MIESIAGFHIEPTNICTLKCSGCARTVFLNQWPQHWKNQTLDIDVLLKFLDIDLFGKTINLCGNYGDPIYHTDFINFVKKLKDKGCVISVVTNGSYRNKDWWIELTECLDNHDSITFSIDGVPENFTQYRQNADWMSIKTGIDVCVSSQVQTVWKYIPFNFNQNTIKEAQQLSVDLGFDSFFLDPSKRFDDESTQDLQPTETLINSEFTHRVKWKNSMLGSVNPKCQTGKEHFITAAGYYTPCCYVADHRWLYKTAWGQQSRYDIKNTTLSRILNQPQVIDFYQNLPNNPVCQFSCPG